MAVNEFNGVHGPCVQPLLSNAETVTTVVGSGTGPNTYIVPNTNQYVWTEPVYDDDDDELEVVEEVVIEREYDDSTGNVTKETRTVRRPKVVERDIKSRTPLRPAPTPSVPWQHPQPWITPPYQQEWWYQQPGWQPNQIYCGDIRPNNNPHKHFINVC